jgi:hypothetical protein
MLDALKSVGFKAILCCKFSVNLGWMNVLLVEKLNDNLLFIAHRKWQNVKRTYPLPQDERLLSERRAHNFIFRRLVHFFLSAKKMDTVDSQILDGGPPQKLIDPPIYNSRLKNDADDSMESIGISLARGASRRQGF